MPQQLQQLHLFPTGHLLKETTRGPLHLDHLTALRLLDNGRETSYSQGEPRPYCHLVVRDGVTLPANLQILVVRDVRSAAPFEQLRHLRKLMLSDCSVSAAHIRLIANYCRHLEDVKLWYATSAIFDEVAAAWRLLPVTELHISSRRVSTVIMQHIADLRDCLQCLDIRSADVMCTAEQLAATLTQLTQLHTLQLQVAYETGCRVFKTVDPAWEYDQQPRQQDVIAATRRDFVVSHAIASLPKLTNLLLGCAAPHMPNASNALSSALFPLCTATQITKVKLTRFGVTNHVLQCLVAHLTALRSLSITHDNIFDAGCLADIAANLHSLECLDLTASVFTVDDCHEQQALGQLQGVQIRVSRKPGCAKRSVPAALQDFSE